MSSLLAFLKVTLLHKWFVFLAGLRTGAPLWRLVIHDWSKFLPSEALAYARHFYGPKDDPKSFNVAWLLHQNRQPHHWEYWIPRTPGTSKPNGQRDRGRYLLRDEHELMWIVDSQNGERIGYYVPKPTVSNGHYERGPVVSGHALKMMELPRHADMVVQLSVLVDYLNDHVPQPLPMPEWAVREMVADWMGASRAYSGHWPTAVNWPWWEKNALTINLHPATRAAVEILIAEVLK